MPNEEIDPSSVFVAAKQAADDARAVLVKRLADIKAEAKQIRELLGRKPRAAKTAKAAAPKKTKKTKKTKPAIELAETA